MKHLHTFEDFLNESNGPGGYDIRPALKKLRSSLKDDDVVFTVDDEKLDQMLNSKFGSSLDIDTVNGDEYYSLSKRDFDSFMDLADSSGFDVDYDNSEDSVIYVYESRVNEAQNFNVKDLPKGAILTFNDGETWMVTKVIGNSSDPQGYLLAPYGKTKDHYISMQIEFSIKKLEDDLISVK